MDVLEFIFVLGVNFSIFGFIWGLITLLLRLIRSGLGQGKQVTAEIYGLRIVKYFLLVSVTANYIHLYQTADVQSRDGIAHIVIGVLVMALYLLGKLQSRSIMKAMAGSPLLGPFAMPHIDMKIERMMLLGSLIYFIACLFLPWMVENGVINWFTDSIIGVYEAPVIGWIFRIIAFFFLLSIFLRAANVIGRLLTGQPLTIEPKVDFRFRTGSNPFEQFRDKQQGDPEWTDYEEVPGDDKKS